MIETVKSLGRFYLLFGLGWVAGCVFEAVVLTSPKMLELAMRAIA